MAVNGDDEREADGRFGGGDGDGKDRDHHAGRLLRLRTEAPERNEIQIRRCQHHLDTDENENSVTPAERGEQSDAEQRRRYDQEKLKRGIHG